MSKDVKDRVRSCVAGNIKITVSILIKLAEDRESGVRSSVSQDPKTPITVIKILMTDESKTVAQNAESNHRKRLLGNIEL